MRLSGAFIVTTKSIFQVVIGSLLEELSVLQSLDEFKLLSLHAFDHGLVLNAFLLLPHHLVFYLLLCAHLLLNQLTLLFLTSLYLLSFDHLLQRVVLHVFLLLDNLHVVSLLSLLILDCIDVSLDLFLEVAPCLINILPVLLLDSSELSLSEHLFLLLLALSFLALLLHFHVALACNQNVVRALLCLVELLPRLLLLLLEKGNSV